MRRRRMLAAGVAVVAAAVVFAAVGFGSGGSAVPALGGRASVTALGGGAEVAPASAVAFVALDTNMSSGQWQALDGLLAKFPGYDTLVGDLQQSLSAEDRLELDERRQARPRPGGGRSLAADRLAAASLTRCC